MLSLTQRLILGYLLLLALLAGVAVYSSTLPHRVAAHPITIRTAAALSHEVSAYSTAAVLLGLLVAAGFAWSILKPLHRTAADARRIGQGELQHRVEWRTRDDLGVIATEMNRMAVRLRDLRDTESGRKQMEHQFSDAVVQSIFDAVIVTDAKGHVLKLNQAAKELLGDAAGDRMALTNTPGGERILSAVRDAVGMQRAVTTQGNAAILPMRIGQAERSFRLRTTPMRDAEGKLLGAVSVLEDVTALQEIDQFKTRFLTIASQKLQRPLEQLRLSLYTLTRGFAGELRPLQAEVLQGAEQEAERLNDLMVDLVAVSELETGRRELRTERLRPNDLLRDAQSRFRQEAARKKIEIEVRAFSDLSPVLADRSAMRSILDNLLSNALRFTPEQGSILLRAEESKDKVQFLVHDTGTGIPAERLPNIFGRFNVAADQGTGLGLALVRRLVELQGGQVSVESRLGQGTTFSFTLPVAVAVPDTRHPIEVG